MIKVELLFDAERRRASTAGSTVRAFWIRIVLWRVELSPQGEFGRLTVPGMADLDTGGASIGVGVMGCGGGGISALADSVLHLLLGWSEGATEGGLIWICCWRCWCRRCWSVRSTCTRSSPRSPACGSC